MVLAHNGSPVTDPRTLPGALVLAAQRAGLRTLAGLLGLGAVGTAAALRFSHGRVELAAPFVVLGAFAGWALTTRAHAALEPRGQEAAVDRALLHAIGIALIVLGAVAFTVAVFAVTFIRAGPAPIL